MSESVNSGVDRRPCAGDSMVANLTFFPVDNGDMTLLEFESGRKLVIDVNIREAADDPDDDTPDVARKLRDRLNKDDQGRNYVDAFLLSHPDEDHCRGLAKHFHLGSPNAYSKKDNKIFIREIWSSPLVFRRKSRNHVLCEDALAFNAEARRRANLFKSSGGAVGDGDRILILGEDEDKTKMVGLEPVLIRVDEVFSRINGSFDPSFTTRLLAPIPKSNDELEEDALEKNRSSTILRFSIMGEGVADAGRFLAGGDAEVAIWERLWKKHKFRADWLSYDILLTPHHCSWHSLSYDSWSEMGEDAKVRADARSALAQARAGANLVASSKPISDDDGDPPCVRAKREYVSIAKGVSGEFRCTAEYPSKLKPDTMEFEIGRYGPRLRSKALSSPYVVGAGAVGGDPLPHG